jgi:molecular chaperone DnaK
VAIGAAVQAGVLAGELKDILLLDVTPVSIGLETIGGLMKKLIPRNTTIPVRRSDVFSTSEDNQTSVEVNVVQGEREMASGNKTLGKFKLMGIPPAPRGIPQVQVSLDIDANGILQVTAMDRTTGREQSITIQGASTLSPDEVQMMIRDAEVYADSDRLRREKVEKRNRAEAMVVQAERQLREATLDFGMNFVASYRSRIEPLNQRLRQALGDNDERLIDITEADLKDAISDLQREVYDRNQEYEKEGGFFEAVKDFFLDEDDDYYDYNNRRDGYDYNPGSYNYGNSSGPGRYGNSGSLPPSRNPSFDDWSAGNRAINSGDYRSPDYQNPNSNRQEPRRDSYDDRPNDRPNSRPNDRSANRPNDQYDARPSDRPRNDDRYDDRYDSRSNDRPNDRSREPERYDDRYDARPTDRSNDQYDDRYDSRNDDRYDDRARDVRKPADRDASRDRKPRSEKPNYNYDNWDGDDW